MRTQTLPGLLDRFLAGDELWAVPSAAREFQPGLDLTEYPDRYELALDIPGVDRKDVAVEFSDGVLSVRGERASEVLPEDGRVLRRERRGGSFARTVAFRDEIEVGAIEAHFRDGVLRVSVPKSEKSRPREIPVAVH